MKKKLFHQKTTLIIILIFILLLSITSGLFFWSVRFYKNKNFGLKSPISNNLRVFLYNESVFKDPVPACWYDSGDYLVFLNRNVQTFYYLSLAYTNAQNEDTKSDLKYVLDRQKKCIDAMLEQNYKQFGDQKNHGLNLPPLFNKLFYTRNNYKFKNGEGKDIYILYGLALKNIGLKKESEDWLTKSKQKQSATATENCCEEGPLTMTNNDLSALEKMSNQNFDNAQPDWDLSLENIAFLEKGNINDIKSYLQNISNIWEESNAENFQYLGGNYDIAGTIAFERLYAKKTNDDSFENMSKDMTDYLNGKNKYQIDFTNYPNIYHPCSFFGNCKLRETLINGVDESKEFNKNRKDIWRLTEVQLPGQAKYVLATILYSN